MAAIVNARDVALQSVNPRILSVGLPPNVTITAEQVGGLPEYVSTAKGVVLRPSSQVFVVPTAGAVVPSSIVLSAMLRNIVGTPVFSVVSGVASLNVSGNTCTILANNMSSVELVVEVAVTYNSTTYKDRVTIVRAIQGGSVTGVLTNEDMTVALDNNGNIASGTLAVAGGKFRVFEGNTEYTGSGVTYSVVSASGVDVSIAATGVYTVDSITADVATATLRAVRSGVTVDRIYKVARSKTTQNVVGARGSVTLVREIAGSAWLDSEAFLAITESGYSNVNDRDIVTLYNAAGTFTQTKFYDGSGWQTLDAYVNGNMLVKGTVYSDALATGAVTANKINVTKLDAISADLGAITGGSLNINNKFIVSATGAATIKSGSSGQRTEIDNNGVRVYDANGVLRVRLGVW